ncbi:MAG: spore germination protein [Syntrophomonadaceae bacterium]|jgi:spore germination protein KA
MRYLTRKQPPQDEEHAALLQEKSELVQQPLSAQLDDNLENLKELLKDCSDAVTREFSFGLEPSIRCGLFYFDGLIDKQEIEENLIRPLLRLNYEPSSINLENQPQFMAMLIQRLLPLGEIKTLATLEAVADHITAGDTVMLVDGQEQGVVVGSRSWASRSIESPENESTIWGPKEGFTETLRSNTSQLRRRLKSTDFKMFAMSIGRISKTSVVVCYIENIASEGLIAEVKRRLAVIDIDAILDAGYLEEYISDEKYSLLAQVEYTEKPDRVCGHLLEGRVAILVDGSPMAMVVPARFPQFLNAGEDYYQNFIAASLFRILRFCAFFIALLLPSVYVAVVTYHHEMIPLPLYLTLVAARQGVPFPAAVEALMLELTFELLREAGLRLPRAIGPAVSIVGALIIGDAAVKAGLVGTPMVVVVAFTGIASFATPSYNSGLIVRIARFPMLLLAATLGFFGIIMGLLVLAVRMASLSSLGQPYLSPLAPLNLAQISDILVRRPWTVNNLRPYQEGMKNQVRQQLPPDKEDA